MSTKYRFTENEVAHFITMTLVEWVHLFSREKYKELIIENLNFCIKEKGLTVHAYVIYDQAEGENLFIKASALAPEFNEINTNYLIP